MTETGLITLEQASKEIDKVVLECVPLAGMQMTTFTDTLKLANGIKTLRQIFLTHPGIKDIVTSMQDTKLGFLTDRSPRPSQGRREIRMESLFTRIAMRKSRSAASRGC